MMCYMQFYFIATKRLLDAPTGEVGGRRSVPPPTSIDDMLSMLGCATPNYNAFHHLLTT